MSPGTAQQLMMRLEERRRDEFRRFVWISLALHVLLAVAVVASPKGSGVAPPRGVQVRLVAPPAASKPAPAAPRARPAPAPKPKPPKPAPVVLPTQPSEPRPRPQSKPRPKPPEPAPQPPAQEQDLSDVLAELRAERGEQAPAARTTETAPAAAPQAGTPDGVPISPEVAAWQRKAKVHVRRNWVGTGAFEMHSLATTVMVELDAAGNVRGEPSVQQRSGNPWYDDNVVRSIRKASPFPPPPRAGRWPFIFYSDRD